MRYIVSAQSVFDKAWDLYLEHRDLPRADQERLVDDPQADLAALVSANESRRVEALLFAGEPVVSRDCT
ncbi:hypothetical protein [Nocardia brasiliensis]|uniref:hypothetical protein n=1 Tax=Nocardia brasiliensis TaxID=37326 RepID=UPI00366DD2E6